MKNLIVALVKFQKEVPAIQKNKVNPFYSSKYADLAQVIDTCSPALNNNGLAIVQTLNAKDGKNLLVTILCHESGETMESSIHLPEINDAQKLTGAITYLRRAAYLSICGLCADDDLDGNELVSAPVNNNTQRAPATSNNALASDAQKSLLKRLGIQFQDNITKNEASKLIEANKK